MRAASIAFIASAGGGGEKNSENPFRYIHTISEERRSNQDGKKRAIRASRSLRFDGGFSIAIISGAGRRLSRGLIILVGRNVQLQAIRSAMPACIS
jgi:hypothetical protein